MSPDYRRVLRALLGTVYGGVGLYAGIMAQSLLLVGVVALLAVLTYASVALTDGVVARDWDRVPWLPPKKTPPRLPPPASDDGEDS
jgi:hypothetical protein